MEKKRGFAKGLTNYGDPAFSLYLRRSFAKSMGYSSEMLGRPVVGIADSKSGFNTNSTDIKPGFHSTLDKIADVVVRYGKTTLTVAGHTDDVGSAQSNQGLSERRARSVAQYLESRRVQEVRLNIVGKGEAMPIASNATEGGRAENRRVEIYVQPVVEGS